MNGAMGVRANQLSSPQLVSGFLKKTKVTSIATSTSHTVAASGIHALLLSI